MIKFLGNILNFLQVRWWINLVSIAVFCLIINIAIGVESDNLFTVLLVIALISLFPIAFYIFYGVVIYPIKQLIKLLKK